jgi:ubiquinone/menaquinone biosynthesis C-methylase UbiE
MAGVGEVFGLDISRGQLKRCSSLIHRRGWPVDLFLANAEQLPFTDCSFDSVFHIGGINFFSDQQKAISEMIRVAKPGTKLIICDENESGALWYEKFLPGFKAAFQGQRKEITSPVDLIPPAMLDIKVGNIWNDFMYCIEFNKPNNM